MSIHYKDYKWKEGIPYGIEKCDPMGTTYKIPMDPYRKRITIEQYEDTLFKRVIYDSCFLNFRHLKPEHQMAWEKRQVGEHTEIRDQDDRLLFREEYSFEGDLCRECRLTSPHGILLSIHKMFYKRLEDSFNGVILYDTNDHPVISKTYEVDEETGLFTELIEENANV